MDTSTTLITMERLFQALSDRTRLRLLNLVADQEVCVCYFVEILGAPQPTISRHLAYLRRAGLIKARREGKWMHYRINMPQNPLAAQVLTDTLRALAGDKQMQRDCAGLNRNCCAPGRPKRLRNAPMPIAIRKTTHSGGLK